SLNVSITIVLLTLLTKRVNNSTLIVFSHQTCQQQYPYCLFSSNVSTTVPLLSFLIKRVNNTTLIVFSHQTCQQHIVKSLANVQVPLNKLVSQYDTTQNLY